MGDRVTNTIFLEPVTIEEVKNIVMSLKNGAAGYDDIPANILKSCIQFLSEPLEYLCSRSLIEGIFPRELKLANVVPLFKSGDPMLFTNTITDPYLFLMSYRRFLKRSCTCVS